MAGELAQPVDVWALLCVGVVDDAITRTRDDLLVAGLRHELSTEDVGTVTRTDGGLDLLVVRVGDDQVGVVRS